MRVVDTAKAWYAFGLRLFAFSLPLGATFVFFAPIPFVRVLGAVALAGSALGLAASLAGLRLEAPADWQALRHDLRRRFVPAGMSRRAS